MRSVNLTMLTTLCAALIAAWPAPGQAIDKCTARVSTKTGALEISASKVGTNPRWGIASGAAVTRFMDESSCFAGGKLKKCHLGEAGTLAERTPPPECVVCVGDDGPNDCCVLVKGCTPGVRLRNASFPADDPRLPDGETGERIFSAMFSCEEALQPGQLFFGTVPPLAQERTEILVHNPNGEHVTFYTQAVRAAVNGSPSIAPGTWTAQSLEAEHATKLDCDVIAKMLTGNPAATFIGTYGIGVKVDGFVVIGVGPDSLVGQTAVADLDVTAQSTRGSEVLKKDVQFQPWFWWWWWPLPWRLGFPYERSVSVSAGTNIDCRGTLYQELLQDASLIADTTQRALTVQALNAGQQIDPTNVLNLLPDAPPALVALIGRCELIDSAALDIEYLLVSNKGETDADPRGGTTAMPTYPWIPGHWYDLSVVAPQNVSVDLDSYLRQWQTQRWIDQGQSISTVQSAMAYFFPWWCGSAYWWGWGGGGSCVDIGVGDGQSIDVEQIVPTRVSLPIWPPLRMMTLARSPNARPRAASRSGEDGGP